ncbi:MAG: rod shape-determining protein RodA [Holosporales bacterium]|nr:rod shape-determining protein RodA [Holosporales bacterium]
MFSFELKKIPLIPLWLVFAISTFGICILCSINSGNFFPWGIRQLIRLCIGTVALFSGAYIPIHFWKKYAYFLYMFGVALLICVVIAGKISMGAQRWISMFSFNFQPSELMRMFLIFAIAKYFSSKTVEQIRTTVCLIPGIVILTIPMTLVLIQPDLGTAIIFFCVCISIFFVCGVQIWKFVIAFLGGITSIPLIWHLLHDYQKSRILMFFSPEKDPNGAGYHVIQSKIALGSGGIFGKGLLNGSQCQLNFLPEKQTDFVFAALGEELGFIGCLILIILFAILIMYNFIVFTKQRSKFRQILVFGLNAMLFFYVFINISMVCGMLPVVGIPLPFFSYGGSALVVLMFCQGIIFSADIDKNKLSERMG